MSTVLVISNIEDAHARAVVWGLRQAGVSSMFWGDLLFPSDATSSELIDSANADDVLHVYGGTKSNLVFSSVWNRRQPIIVLHEETNEADVDFVQRESEAFVKALLAAVRSERWVNSNILAQLAESKCLQLRIASKCGFLIPDTLFSNDPEQIREFIEARTSGAVFKSYWQNGWAGPSGTRSFTRVRKVEREDLIDDQVLRLCPGIYQEYIAPEIELRVTCFGDHVCALQINTGASGVLDWRYDLAYGKQ